MVLEGGALDGKGGNVGGCNPVLKVQGRLVRVGVGSLLRSDKIGKILYVKEG